MSTWIIDMTSHLTHCVSNFWIALSLRPSQNSRTSLLSVTSQLSKRLEQLDSSLKAHPVSTGTRLTTTTMPTLRRLLYHPVLPQRRDLALRTCSKDVVIFFEEEGENDQSVQMSFIDSGAAVGSRLKDVSLEDVELDLLWQFLGKDSFKYWLAWSRIGTDLAINNDTRLREMIQTQKEIADESREVEELPVYALSLRKGRTPIDKADHLLALILVSVCVVLCWLIGLSVGSRVGMELKFITSALFL
jgi:hypothetical protein